MGATIQHVEDYYRRMAENGAKRSSNGVSIFRHNDKTGTDDRVFVAYDKDKPINFSRAMKNVEGGVAVLNRNLRDVGEAGEKGTANQYGAGPTSNELLNFADSKWKEMRITVANGQGGSTTYVVTAGPNFDREGFKNYIQGLRNTQDRNAENSYKTQLRKAKERGLSPEAAALEARYRSGGHWTTELRRNATVGMKTNRTTTDSNGNKVPVFKKFDLQFHTIRNAENTPVNRPTAGRVKQISGSGRNPKRDTTPKPKKPRKRSTNKK